MKYIGAHYVQMKEDMSPQQLRSQVAGLGWVTERFEANRSHLRGVAFRMLGSLTEADDAVQEAWIRLSRTDTSHVDNLRAWLTTVVGRVCLNMLRSRKTRREASLETHLPGLF
jgi:DNA-directed RNA polymerase specialized sigma24 family protein